MKRKVQAIAASVALALVMTVAGGFALDGSTVYGASVKKPSKVTISSAKKTSATKVKVTWKKLKKSPSGYAIYQKKGNGSWKLVKRVSKKTTSATVTAMEYQKNQFKVRAYNTYKVKKYYNKKTKKYISKKAYYKLSKKYRTTKKVTAYKYGSYSSTKTVAATGKSIAPSVTMEDWTSDAYNPVYVILQITKFYPGKYTKNARYIVEKSVNGGEYEIMPVEEIYYTDFQDGLDYVEDQEPDPTATLSYRIHAEAESLVDGKTLKSDYQYITFENGNFLTVATTYKSTQYKYCAVCLEDVSAYDMNDKDFWTFWSNHHEEASYCHFCLPSKNAADITPEMRDNNAVSHDSAAVFEHIKKEHCNGDDSLAAKEMELLGHMPIEPEGEITETGVRHSIFWTEVTDEAEKTAILEKHGYASASKVYVDSADNSEDHCDQLVILLGAVDAADVDDGDDEE
jgi:hypothetical protein